jgi:hypothetical protein
LSSTGQGGESQGGLLLESGQGGFLHPESPGFGSLGFPPSQQGSIQGDTVGYGAVDAIVMDGKGVDVLNVGGGEGLVDLTVPRGSVQYANGLR